MPPSYDHPNIAVSRTSSVRVIGELCFAGDRACVQQDLGALAGIARQLARLTPEPLHCELMSLAEACDCDRTSAIATWSQIRDRLYGEPWAKASAS